MYLYLLLFCQFLCFSLRNLHLYFSAIFSLYFSVSVAVFWITCIQFFFHWFFSLYLPFFLISNCMSIISFPFFSFFFCLSSQLFIFYVFSFRFVDLFLLLDPFSPLFSIVFIRLVFYPLSLVFFCLLYICFCNLSLHLFCFACSPFPFPIACVYLVPAPANILLRVYFFLCPNSPSLFVFTCAFILSFIYNPFVRMFSLASLFLCVCMFYLVSFCFGSLRFLACILLLLRFPFLVSMFCCFFLMSFSL